MKLFTYNYKKPLIFLVFIYLAIGANAQNDTSRIKRKSADTSNQQLNMDAVYNRPFLSSKKLPVAIGGYLEANTQYASTDGVTDGLSFQARRFTIFLSSTIAKKIKFLSEIEFEDGAKEINIEFAAIDMEFHPLLNLRGGIVMNPIGAFNQNHDGPRWEFIDRPLSATTIIPSTLSNVGFGIHGKYFVRKWIFGYETYLTNGFDDKIISNTDNRTSLSAGKLNPTRFEESNNGIPMFTGKVAVRNRIVGEIGLSYMRGIYNKFQADGLVLDDKRSMQVMAFDFNTTQFKNKLYITGEIAKVIVDIPETYTQTFGSQQLGGFIDLIATVLQRKIGDWEKARVNIAARLEYADYNKGTFRETGGNIADHVWAIVPGIAFRPVGTTVLRFNYRFQQQTDLLGNPPAKTGVVQFGFSSYF